MVKDHLGNEFKTISKMCRHYNMKANTFHDRVASGWSVKDALTIPPKEPIEYEFPNGVRDHLGNTFPSVISMCEHYGVSESTYKYRRAKGLPLAERLVSSPDKTVKDHKGNEFATLTEMYAAYNISKTAFQQRRRKGLSLKECLTGEKPVHDHLGNAFSTVQEMLAYHNVSSNEYYHRKQIGWSLRECLTGEHLDDAENYFYDHKGNKFKNAKEACKFYQVNETTFGYRKQKGFSLEECLTGIKPENKYINEKYQVEDHEGNKFKSVEEMCLHHGTTYDKYLRKKKKGLPLEECLKPTYSTRCEDHVGQVFESKKAMCMHYGINVQTYDKRRKEGWNIEDALTTIVENGRIPIFDHFGNSFSSKKAMCEYHNVDYNSFLGKIKRGASVKDALAQLAVIDDGYGHVFKNEVELCDYYGIDNTRYKGRKGRKCFSMEECLGLIPMLTWCVKNYALDDELTIVKMILSNDVQRNTYFECKLNEKDVILHREDIISHYRKRNGYIGGIQQT